MRGVTTEGWTHIEQSPTLCVCACVCLYVCAFFSLMGTHSSMVFYYPLPNIVVQRNPLLF